MVKISNNEKKVEILTDIGASFFSEGMTADVIANQIKEIEGDFDLIVGSLGGDVHEALMIHDIIKMHPGTVTTKIIGLTASSGTIIALAGDKVTMSSNASFLVHNASTWAAGNRNDFEKAIEVLDAMDGVIASLYSRKTGKRKSQLLTLMEQERWLSPEEAKDWGFVDKIFTPETPQVMNSMIDQVNHSNLPKFNNSTDMNILDEIRQLIAKDDKVAEISNLKADIQNITSERDGLKVDIQSKEAEINNLSAKVAELENQKTGFDAKLAEKESAYNTLKNEFVQYAKDKLDKIKCEALGVDDFSFIENQKGDQSRVELIMKKTRPSIKDLKEKD